MPDCPVRLQHTFDLLCVEGLLQEIDQFGRSLNGQIRGDGVIAIRNWFDCHRKIPPYSGINEGLPVLAVWPPSATNAAPVTNDARSEAKNRTTFAISSGCPSRPIGIASLILSANPGCASAGASSGVSMA